MGSGKRPLDLLAYGVMLCSRSGKRQSAGFSRRYWQDQLIIEEQVISIINSIDPDLDKIRRRWSMHENGFTCPEISIQIACIPFPVFSLGYLEAGIHQTNTKIGSLKVIRDNDSWWFCSPLPKGCRYCTFSSKPHCLRHIFRSWHDYRTTAI